MSVFCSKRLLLLVGFYLVRQIIPNLTEFAADNSGHQLIVRRMSCRTFYLTSRLKFQLTRGGLLNSVDSTWTQLRRSLWRNPRWSPLRSPSGLNLRQTFYKSPRPGGLVELSPLSLDFKFDPRWTHVESVGVRDGVGGSASFLPWWSLRWGSSLSNRNQVNPPRTHVEPRRTRVHQLDPPT